MGLKRPFDAEEMQECNAKHARQLSFSNHQHEAIPLHVSFEKPMVLVEDLSGLSEDADHVEKEFDTWIPCQLDNLSQSTLSNQSSGSDSTWRPLSPVEDVYSCLMNHPPRKQVPVGSNHQADIPECVADRSTNSDSEGKCIIPMSESDVCETGQGRKECLCLDKGSIRCVRRHIMEARENLIETIGYERFKELGFCEMGDEVVARLWNEEEEEEEEDLFHKVVYSNPVSLGRDFWKELKTTFPTRTMKELVSYYFNVFILRRRSIQNRVRTLDVDSDDDEWQIEYNRSLDEEDNNGKSSSHEDNEEEEEEEDVHCVYMDKISREHVGEEDSSCMSFDLQDCWSKNNDLLPTSNIIEEIFGQDDNSRTK